MNSNRIAILTSALALRSARALRCGAALALLAVLGACSGGGGPGVQANQPAATSTAQSYTGPAPQDADVLAFQINLWQNIMPSDRCGGCHHADSRRCSRVRTTSTSRTRRRCRW